MFKIDLLKGQGVPLKSSPGGIAITAITIAIPLYVLIMMFGFYVNDITYISVKEQEVARCQSEIDKLSGAVKLQESLEKEKILYSACLSEVKSSIGKYVQWSPVLVTLVENMPNSVMLTELEVRQDSITKKVPKKDNPQEMVDGSVPINILRMSISGGSQYDCNQEVRDFQDRLQSSDFLGPKLENIVVSRESEILKGRDVASYEIDCVFKPRL
jgi:Tfp pilus assembly protein PilN